MHYKNSVSGFLVGVAGRTKKNQNHYKYNVFRFHRAAALLTKNVKSTIKLGKRHKHILRDRLDGSTPKLQSKLEI